MLIALIGDFAFSSPQSFSNARPLNPLPEPKHQFIVVCHRGDHEHAPENTQTAYANAIKAGADYVEIDLRTTADSQLVIMHDASVDRMTTGTGQVKDLTWDQLKQLKVKDKSHPECNGRWSSISTPRNNSINGAKPHPPCPSWLAFRVL
jgi:glycerophosphoryl diester phosphodiesterase